MRYFDRVLDRTNQSLHLVTEYCSEGDLYALIKKCKRERRYVSEDLVWSVFHQLLKALDLCHNREEGTILHRDVKPANIFLASHNKIKLGDFGLARVLGSNSVYAKTYVGTPYYMSPEQVRSLRYDSKSDVWSVGCVIYELAALDVPFTAKSQLELAVKIKAGKFPPLPRVFSSDLQRVVRQMLQVNPRHRPSVARLLQHPRFRTGEDDEEPTTSRSSGETAAVATTTTATTTTTTTATTATAAAVATAHDRERRLADRERRLAERESALKVREAKVERVYAMLKRRLAATESLDEIYANEGISRKENRGVTGTTTYNRVRYNVKRPTIPTSRSRKYPLHDAN